MTGEVYDKLKPYEGVMDCAEKCGYVRLNARQADELSVLYGETFGKPFTRQQRTCGTCLRKAVVQLYQEYKKYKNSPWGKRKENADQD